MEIVDNMDLYKPQNAIPIIVSVLLFILYGVITMMDTNIFIKEYGIGDEVIGIGKFLYSYVAGYFTFFLKLVTSMLTLYVLLSIIRVSVIVIFNVLRPVALGGAGEEDFKGSIFGKAKTALKNNALWILGIYLVDKFIISFVFTAPVLLFLMLIGFALRLYNYNFLMDLKDNDENEEALRILGTTHHHMMFLLSVIFAIVVIYIFGIYVFTFNIKNADLLKGESSNTGPPLPASE